ncbi:ly6/PLAUR domain-containing protein 6B [Eurytemora carolleeae]|uniref:ly6/PLAUR domain-containing protein 6B n=1 Tax=Eurytemora carolleeae TaxID=1294199 RepID=UPI000C78038D|nr:ly6/PLAUR domain-containing protein 6B [Eurytemora carolleeae]|eukprot:XP_023328605.1 ly6/PLAUR domain-containing protein 6B-like [Eurytemora affinis]
MELRVQVILTILLHLVCVSTGYRDQGFPTSITCFTCSNRTSNPGCNQVAVDRPCPAHLPACMSRHNLSNGRTISVSKTCSTKQECTQLTGCYRDQQLQVCISCCDESYCNEGIPWTPVQAVYIKSDADSILKASIYKLFVLLTVVVLVIDGWCKS